MGLLKTIKKIKRKERHLRILVLGLDGAGKSSVVRNLMGLNVHDVSPTFGFEIKTLFYGPFFCNLWDIGGQSTIRAYWRNYYEETDGIIWVVDSSDAQRLAAVKAELEGVLKESRLAGASLLVFANKQDLPEALTSHEIAAALGLASVKSHSWKVFSCTALCPAASAIKEGFDWMMSDIQNRCYFLNKS